MEDLLNFLGSTPSLSSAAQAEAPTDGLNTSLLTDNEDCSSTDMQNTFIEDQVTSKQVLYSLDLLKVREEELTLYGHL